MHSHNSIIEYHHLLDASSKPKQIVVFFKHLEQFAEKDEDMLNSLQQGVQLFFIEGQIRKF